MKKTKKQKQKYPYVYGRQLKSDYVFDYQRHPRKDDLPKGMHGTTQKYTGFRTAQEAFEEGNKRYEEYLHRVMLESRNIPLDITFGDYVEAFHNKKVEDKIQSQSKANEEIAQTKRYLPTLLKYKIRDIDETMLRNALLSPLIWKGESEDGIVIGRGNGLGDEQRRRLVSRLRTLFKEAYERGILTSNPMAGIKNKMMRTNARVSNPADDEDKSQVVISRAQFNLLIDEIRRRYTISNEKKELYIDILNTMYHTGIRTNECYSLKFSDYDEDKKTIKISHQMQRETMQDLPILKTPNSYRTIKADRIVVEIIERRKKKYEKTKEWTGDGYIFGLKFMRSSAIDALIAHIKKDLDNRGLLAYDVSVEKNDDGETLFPSNFRLYNLRHSFASEFLRKYPTEVYTLSQLMGNTPDTIMRYYRKWLPDERKRAEECMENLFV